MDQLAKARPSIGADHRHRTRRLAVTYQTIEVVERAGHGEEQLSWVSLTARMRLTARR